MARRFAVAMLAVVADCLRTNTMYLYRPSGIKIRFLRNIVGINPQPSCTQIAPIRIQLLKHH